MSLVQTNLDLPQGLHLTDIQTEIVRGIVSGKRVDIVSKELGVPKASILNLIRQEKVKEFMQEMVDARNLTLKMELPNLLMQMIQDKIEDAEANDEKLGSTTKKDIVDIIKQLNDTLKVSDSSSKADDSDGFTKIYNSINLIQGEANGF